MNTTIFLPMPEWQALSFLRNRSAAFERLLTPAGNHLPCELVLGDDAIYGFKQRADAVEVGKRVYPQGFAMVRFVVNGKVLNGYMGLQRQLVAASDPGTGYALWRMNRGGLESFNEKVGGDCEILVDQIFNGEPDAEGKTCAPVEEVDHGFLEDGGRPVGFAHGGTARGAVVQSRSDDADTTGGGFGPLGFGC